MYSNDWHLRDTESVAGNLRTDPYSGLTESEASKRLKKNGRNRIWRVDRASATGYALSTAGDLTTLLLILTSVVAAIFGKSVTAAAVGVVLIIGLSCRVLTYIKAKRILEDAAKEGIPNATVLREGKPRVINADSIVKGDVIILGEGDVVPCDGRIITEEEVRVSERGVTDNKKSVIKRDTVILTDSQGPDVPCEYRVNMLFAGSVILSGTCRMIVTACADDTLICMKEGGTIVPSGEKLPVIEKYENSCRTSNLFMLGMVVVVSVLAFVLNRSGGLTDTFFEMLSLAAASMTTYFSAVCYIMVAVPVREAAKGKKAGAETGRAYLKDCSFVEAVAGVDRIVVSDSSFYKSGDVTFTSFYHDGTLFEAGKGDPETLINLLSATVCSVSDDRALKSGAEEGRNSRKVLVEKIAGSASSIRGKKIRSDFPVVDHVETVESGRTVDTSVIYRGASLDAVVSGDPAAVLAMCDRALVGGENVFLSDAEREKISREADAARSRGEIVLAVASRISPSSTIQHVTLVHSRMRFEGFVTAREELAAEDGSVAAHLRSLGIKTAILSDDPELDLNLLSRGGVISENAVLISAAELAKAGSVPEGDFIVRVPSYEDKTLKKTLISDMRCSAVGKIISFGEKVAVVTREALDSRMMNGSSVGIAVSSDRYRPIPQTLKRRSGITVYPSAGGNSGGFAESFRVIAGCIRSLNNISAAMMYVISSQTARIICAVAAAFLGAGLNNPVGILTLGLIFDFFAVIAMAFSRKEELTRESDGHSGKKFVSGVVYGAVWGVLCSLVPVAGLFEKNRYPMTAGASSAVMIAMLLCQLTSVSAYIADGFSPKKYRPGRAYVCYGALTVLLCVLLVVSRKVCSVFGDSLPPVSMIVAALSSAVVLFAASFAMKKILARKEKNIE